MAISDKHLVYFIDLDFPTKKLYIAIGQNSPILKLSSHYHIKFRICCRLFVLTKYF